MTTDRPFVRVPPELRGAPPTVVVAWLEGQGVDRREAIVRAWHYRRSVAGRQARTEPQLPWRRAARELAGMRWAAIMRTWRGEAGREFREKVLDVVRFTWRRSALRGLAPPGDVAALVLEISAPPVAARAIERWRGRLERLASEALEGRPRVEIVLHWQMRRGRAARNGRPR